MGTNYTYFGDVSGDTQPRPYSFWGISGFWTLPRAWYTHVDADGTMWGSPNPLTKNPDGTVTGTQPIYALDLTPDGILVFIDAAKNRAINIDSPARDRLSSK